MSKRCACVVPSYRFDLGTSDDIALDILLNTLFNLSEECVRSSLLGLFSALRRLSRLC